VIEGLGVTVLPRAAGVDVEGFDLVVGEPLLDGLGNKWALRFVVAFAPRYRPVVRADVFGSTVPVDGLLEHLEVIARFDRTVRVDAVTLAGMLIDEVEAAKFASTLRVIGHEVPSPDMILVCGLLRQARGESLTTALTWFGRRHLQAFLPTHPLHELLAGHPARFAQLRRDLAVAERGVPAAHLHNLLFEQPLLLGHGGGAGSAACCG